MTTHIFISSNPESLANHLSSFNHTATVEAEYGSVVVEGTEVTLAHHGERADQPCPCLGDNMSIEVDAIGVSHFDLDTLGGILRVLNLKEEDHDLFWQVASLVDVKGVHKLEEIKTQLWREATAESRDLSDLNSDGYFFDCEWDDVLDSLHGFWAWSEANRLFPPRDGSVQDVTDFFNEAIRVINILIEGNELDKEYKTLSQAGRDWAAAKAQLEADSFQSIEGGVILRQSTQFVNHLYSHDGVVGLAVVGYNPEKGSVTISLANPIDGINCCTIAQTLWGPEAGGHAGIAGSPRGEFLDIEAAKAAVKELALQIAVATTEVVPA